MIKKVKYILLFSFLLVLALCTQSQARITTSDPTVESGGTATITINSQEPVAYGSIDVTSNGGLTFVSVSGGTANGTKVAFSGTDNKTSGLATYKFKVPSVTKTTTYKVVFSSADMGNAAYEEVAASSATATVTVKAKQSSSGSSGSGSQSSGNNKPSTPTISFSDANETMYISTQSSVNFRSNYSTSASVLGALTNGTKVTVIGKATKSVDGITWYKIKYNGQTGYVSSAYLSTKTPEVEPKETEQEKESNKSDNNNLKSLEIGAYDLTPEFDADVTEYSLKIDDTVDVLQITAEAEDEKADVKISGNDNLLLGENVIEIKVTAEDESVKTYKINVTKGELPKVELETLTVEGYSITPEFESDVYEYELTINDVSVKELTLNVQAKDEDATIEILGNENFELGKNIITILVKTGEGEDEEVTTYQLIVNIEEPVQEVVAQIIPGIDDDDLFLYGGIGLGVLFVIMVIVAIIVKRRERQEDYDTFDAGFAPLYDEQDKEDRKGRKDKKDRKSEKNAADDLQSDDVSLEKNTEKEENEPKRKPGKHF